MDYYIGVDVGTGSARAGLFNSNGKLIKIAINDIKTFNDAPNYYEQSSDDIWNAVKKIVKEVVGEIPKERIQGIGFDATCSLVLIDDDGEPVTASPSGDDEKNIILWMDHRAELEADLINNTNHEMLKYVGGKISLEMEIPKIMWLKKNLKKSFERAKLLFDLPDFLTWKATGSESRSLCSLVCKWNYNATTKSWNEDFFKKIGLSCLKDNNWKKIGNCINAPGEPVGNGLSSSAANDLGLKIGTPVGTSIIDAHAGGLGMIGLSSLNKPEIPIDFSSRLALICGTSTCHMAISPVPLFVEGIWGPYYSAMLPNYYLNEGGQSATGKLIDHIINTHPSINDIKKKINNKIHVQEYLINLLIKMADEKKLNDVSYLTSDIHIWPDYHGNRSPLADPNLRGMICGLTLNCDENNLAIIYLATLQSIVYGTKHIFNCLNDNGYDIKTILLCGGLCKNKLFCKIHADVIGLPVLIPDENESVLLGSAILGACASKNFNNINDVVFKMSGNASVIEPSKSIYEFHEKKYQVFLKMIQHQREYEKIMNKNFSS